MSYGLPDLLEAVRDRARPRFGAPEEARWQAHRVEVISRALGVSLDPARHPPERRSRVRRLVALAEHEPPHPLASYLASTRIRRQLRSELADVDRLHGDLVALYRAERERLARALFGHVEPVEEPALLEAGLDRSLLPDWDAIGRRE